MRKPRPLSSAQPRFYDFSATVANHEVWILSEAGLSAFQSQFATADDVAAAFGCSRATAYRYMRQLPCWHVTDESSRETRTYTAVELRLLDKIKRGQRGNRHFRDSNYQSALARRPRKRRA